MKANPIPYCKKSILVSTAICMAGLSLSSYSTGPSGTVISCSRSSCHHIVPDKSSFTLSLKEKSSGLIVSDQTYKTNTSYIVTINGVNKDSLEHFGFQTIVSSSKIASEGTLIALLSNTSVSIIGSTPSIGHNTPIKSSTKGLFEISFEWLSPGAGAGDINFYSIINAVNLNGASSGDQPSDAISYVFKEQGGGLGLNEVALKKAWNIYPNPCTDLLTIECPDNRAFMATIYDLNGRPIMAPGHQSNIDVSMLSIGVYILSLSTKEGQQMTTFVKQ